MRRDELIKEVSQHTGIAPNDVELVITKTLAAIRHFVCEGETITLRGFGVFEPVKRKERTYRNIRKGTPCIVPERIIPVFRPSKKYFKARMKGGANDKP